MHFGWWFVSNYFVNLQEKQFCYIDVVKYICLTWIIIGGMTGIWTIQLSSQHKEYENLFFYSFFGNVDIYNFEKKSRKKALIFHVLCIIFWEFIHGVTIYAIYKVFRKPNFEWEDFFRATGEMPTLILNLFNSIQASWIHMKLFHCVFKRVSFISSSLQLIILQNTWIYFFICQIARDCNMIPLPFALVFCTSIYLSIPFILSYGNFVFIPLVVFNLGK